MVKHAVIATFRPDARSGDLTPGGEGGCCPLLDSIKVGRSRAESGRGRNPDPRRDQREGGGLPTRGAPAGATPDRVGPGRFGPGSACAGRSEEQA